MVKIERKTFSKEERTDILSRTNNRCAHCGRPLKANNMTVEHIFPLNKGGTHDKFNLVALCYDCNNNKSNFIYSLKDYYDYVAPEYVEDYMLCFSNLCIVNKDQTGLLDVDTRIYEIIPDKCKEMIYNMIKRGAKKKQIFNIMDKARIKLRLERAYDADAKEILSLMNNYDAKLGYKIGYNYDSEWSIINDIRNEEVYVLRSSDKVCGAFMFKKIKQKLDILQLDTIEMNSCLRQKYILTSAYIDAFAYEVYNSILNDFITFMLKERAIPIFFNIMDNVLEDETDKKEFIFMPYKLGKEDGVIEFLPLNKLKERTRFRFGDYIEKGYITEADLDEYVDVMFNDTDMPSLEFDKLRRDNEFKLTKKIIEARDKE